VGDGINYNQKKDFTGSLNLDDALQRRRKRRRYHAVADRMAELQNVLLEEKTDYYDRMLRMIDGII
jgi:hypothetical protein